jgi:hypothetical protein
MRHILASAASNFVPDMGAASEVVIDYSSGTSEAQSAGIMMNIDPQGRRQRLQGTGLRVRRERCVPGRQLLARTESRGAEHAPRAETLLRRQPLVRRPDPAGPVVVLRLVALAGKLDLPGRRVREQEQRRPDEVELRTERRARPRLAEGQPSAALRFTWQATPRTRSAVPGIHRNGTGTTPS